MITSQNRSQSTPTAPQIDTIHDLILANVEQQRAAIDILADPELADLFAAATTRMIDEYLHGARHWKAVSR